MDKKKLPGKNPDYLIKTGYFRQYNAFLVRVHFIVKLQVNSFKESLTNFWLKKWAYHVYSTQKEQEYSRAHTDCHDIQPQMCYSLYWPHQKSEIGQMITLAKGIGLIGLNQTAATIWPTMDFIVPENTHWVLKHFGIGL